MVRFSTIIIFLFIFQTFASMQSIDSYNFYDVSPLVDDNSAISKKIVLTGHVFPIDSSGLYWLESNPLSIDTGMFLYLPPSPHGIQLYLNGNQIYRWGSGISSECYANYRGVAVSLNNEFLNADSNIVTIALTSDGARTALPPLEIGEFSDVSKKAFWISLFNHILIIVFVGIALFVIVFLIFYYLFSPENHKVQILFLTLFCLSFILTYSMFVFNNFHFDQVLLFKISRIGSIGMSLTLLLYISEVAKVLNGNLARSIISIAYLPYFFTILMGSSKFEINGTFFAASNTLIMPLLLVGLVLLIIGFIIHRKIETVLTFIAYLFMLTSVFSDVYYMIHFNQPIFWKIPYGYFIMIMGGVASFIYQRSRAIEMSDLNLKKVRKEKSVLQLDHDSDSQIIHSFSNSFSAITELVDGGLTRVDNKIDIHLFHLFKYYSIHSQNMFYYDKNRRSELTLWFDAFSLSDSINDTRGAYLILAEESGIELIQNYKFESFPPLLWGDKAAVLQVIANSLLLASVIEKESISITVEYISYEGLQISLNGSDEDFTTSFIGAISDGFANEKYNTASVVLKELFVHLDSKFIKSFIDSKTAVVTIPMSISEEESS